MKIENFREYLKIDKHDLDNVVCQHPTLLFEVGEAYAEAVAERDALKELAATIDAQLDASVREELEGEKITEAMVKNKILTHKDHKTAAESYLAAKELADKWAALKEAFHARSYMIRELAGLYVSNYYTTSSVQDTPATSSAVHKQQRQKLAEARERRE